MIKLLEKTQIRDIKFSPLIGVCECKCIKEYSDGNLYYHFKSVDEHGDVIMSIAWFDIYGRYVHNWGDLVKHSKEVLIFDLI